MNFITRVSFSRANLAKINVFQQFKTSSLRSISVNGALRCENRENPEEAEAKTEEPIDPAIDRTKIIPVETSIRYLKSTAYETTYGEQPVWVQYRRNFKGQFQPLKTRKTCVRAGKISTGNPCPICRDEYLVLDHNNIDLLKQFISEHTGEVISYSKTGLCQKKHLQLLVAIDKAKDHGLITFDVPFRDYSEYYESHKQQN